MNSFLTAMESIQSWLDWLPGDEECEDPEMIWTDHEHAATHQKLDPEE